MLTAPADPLASHRHVVHLYGGDSNLLVRNVARYMKEGLDQGAGIISIATPEHNQAFAAALEDPRSGYIKGREGGAVRFLDAAETLNRVMVAGNPDWSRFQAVLQPVIRDVHQHAGRTGLRAYGEMVGLLWESGKIPAAVRLEEYWNRLMEMEPFSLFCGYPVDVFSRDFCEASLDPVLCAHSHLHPADQSLGDALNQAMDEVLGSRAEGLRLLIKAGFRPYWAHLPPAEATILWLRANLEDVAEEIIARARSYYQATAA